VVETGPWKYVTLDRWLEMLRTNGRQDAIDRIRNQLNL